MKNKFWLWIILGVVAIVIILLIFNWKKWFGKDEENGTSVINSINAQAIADRLYSLMEGLTYSSSDQKEVKKIIKEVLNSSDADFKAVWNAFGKKQGDNLAQWYEDESYSDSATATAFKNRAIKLGLS